MVALKTADIERFMARPDPAKPVILVFGPDTGLVGERADALVRSAVEDPRDPFALARIDGDDLADEPERLVEEAHTVPLFGGRRAVWVKAGTRQITSAVERVLASPPDVDCRIVIEAGDLRRSSPLRTVCERASNAVALPCYADSARDLDRLIEDEVRGTGLTITPEARALLTSLIGEDRAASRAEIRKIVLYAHGKAVIDRDDIAAVVSDASAPALDGLVDAAFAGRTDELETGFAKVRSSGVAASTIVGAAARQAAALHRLRLAVEQGDSIRAAVDSAVPPLHFSRKELVQAAVRQWSAKRLEAILVQFGTTSLDVRKFPRLAYPLVQRALTSIAVEARRRALRTGP
jgi:DNA polymerase III subunit delta